MLESSDTAKNVFRNTMIFFGIAVGIILCLTFMSCKYFTSVIAKVKTQDRQANQSQ